MATLEAHKPRKSKMMERLRIRRGTSTAQPTATALPGMAISTTQRSADVAKGGKAPPLGEAGLDLEMLDSKLQEYARTCSEDGDADPMEAEESVAEEAHQTPGVITKEPQPSDVEGQGHATENAVKEGADSAFDQEPGPTSRHSSQNGASTCPSIVVHPPDDELPPATEPSDFDLFLQQAEVDERIRKETGLPVLPRQKQETSINPFYSKKLANPSSNPPKLAEIQETGDEESLSESDHTSSQHTSSSISSGSNDFAATETQPTRANTASLGRHVSFREPQKSRGRSDSYGSAYHARGFESPKAPRAVGKRRSFRKMVKDCIRHF